MSPYVQIPMLTRLLFFYQTFPLFISLSEICNYVCDLTIVEILEGASMCLLIDVPVS